MPCGADGGEPHRQAGSAAHCGVAAEALEPRSLARTAEDAEDLCAGEEVAFVLVLCFDFGRCILRKAFETPPSNNVYEKMH